MSYYQADPAVVENFDFLFARTATDVRSRETITSYFYKLKQLEAEIADNPACEEVNRTTIKKIRSEIVTSNVRLIVKLAMKMGLDPNHATKWHSAGCVGLVKALNSFDVDFTRDGKSFAFTTYACRCIQIELLHELERHCGVWSPEMTKKIWAVTKALEYLTRAGNINPTDEELLDAIEKCFEIRRKKVANDSIMSKRTTPLITTLKDVRKCRDAQAVTQVDMSAKSRRANNGRDESWSPSDPFVNERLDDVDNQDLVNIILDSVDDRTREMLELHFGLIPGKDPLRQKEICQIYGLTKQRVSQIFIEVGKSVRANFTSPYESSVCRQATKHSKHGSRSSTFDPILRV